MIRIGMGWRGREGYGVGIEQDGRGGKTLSRKGREGQRWMGDGERLTDPNDNVWDSILNWKRRRCCSKLETQ